MSGFTEISPNLPDYIDEFTEIHPDLSNCIDELNIFFDSKNSLMKLYNNLLNDEMLPTIIHIIESRSGITKDSEPKYDKQTLLLAHVIGCITGAYMYSCKDKPRGIN